VKAKIEGISHRGEGVARIDGRAVFIPYALPGEEVQVELIKEQKRFSRGQLTDIVSASPDRIKPACPAYYECGGCAYQHINYAGELGLKTKLVRDTLIRLGGLEAEVMPIIGMKNPWHYRNKVVWHTAVVNDKIDLGFFREGSHDLVSLHGCSLILEDMEHIQNSLAENLNNLKVKPGTEFSLRRSFANGKMSLLAEGNLDNQALVDWAATLPQKLSVHIVQGKNIKTIYGKPFLEEKLCGLTFRVSPSAFLQVNHQQTEKLYALIAEYAALRGREKVLDAFCGIGTIALSLAKHVSRITGIEINPAAIEDAKQNAVINDIDNAEFYAGSCEEVITRLKQQYDLVILDPPRAGCKEDTVRSVVKTNPQKIIYVSCNPSTLARDLKIFVAAGYNVTLVQPLDMFPRTVHVECVTLMSKVEK
jgi:23S rRNA (uracil1939-C5)-methyltransferase